MPELPEWEEEQKPTGGPMEVSFREMRPEDMDAIYFLDRSCYGEAHRFTFGGLMGVMLDREVVTLVAEVKEREFSRLGGVLIVRSDPWNHRLYVVALMVHPDYRRLGIGRRLLVWAEHFGQGYQCREMLIPLEEGNPAGEAFLVAAGFSRTDRTETRFARGPDHPLWQRPVAERP